MDIRIFSRNAMEELINIGFPSCAAVISFASPQKHGKEEKPRICYDGVCGHVFYITIPDIDIGILERYGYTYESYLSEADELADFIYAAIEDGLTIFCQCDYGQSRSAACAAAILQHFEKRGIDIFADYHYYPNQLVYHKVFDALEKHKQLMEAETHE